MSPLWAAIGCFILYWLGYQFYAKYLSAHIYRLDSRRETPAHTLRDEIDYIPTNRFVLFGHHYASITGLAPMLGPAVAVMRCEEAVSLLDSVTPCGFCASIPCGLFG